MTNAKFSVLEINKVKTGFELTDEGGFYVAHARKEETARLIAAAPDLLEALENVLLAYCSQMSDRFNFPVNPWDSRPDEVRDNARAAIAKVQS